MAHDLESFEQVLIQLLTKRVEALEGDLAALTKRVQDIEAANERRESYETEQSERRG